jgi:hypothetical protein
MLALREQYDHPYFWAPLVVVGDGLTGSPMYESDPLSRQE